MFTIRFQSDGPRMVSPDSVVKVIETPYYEVLRHGQSVEVMFYSADGVSLAGSEYVGGEGEPDMVQKPWAQAFVMNANGSTVDRI